MLTHSKATLANLLLLTYSLILNLWSINQLIATIEEYFPGLVVERGKNLNFLGMDIGFLTKGKFSLGLVQYITGMIEDLEETLKPYGENLDRDYPHPAAKWLFTV